jgi:hypothetical protein
VAKKKRGSEQGHGHCLMQRGQDQGHMRDDSADPQADLHRYQAED